MTVRLLPLFLCGALFACEKGVPGVELPATPLPDDFLAGHSMVLLGNKRLILSHIPAFVAPHQNQVLLEATLVTEYDVDFQARYNGDQGTSAAKLYTVDPQPFTWTSVVDGLRTKGAFSFHGDIYRGNLYYGAPNIVPGALFTFTRALWFQALTATNTNPTGERQYVLFSAGEDAYLAHLIVGKPSYDELVMVKVSTEIPAGSVGRELIIPGAFDPAHPQLKEGNELDGTIGGAPIHVQVVKEIYFESDGLI